jgi:hypothetical protein
MLFEIQDCTRDERFVTDHEDNALAFLRAYRKKHAGHVVELRRQKLDGSWESIEA